MKLRPAIGCLVSFAICTAAYAAEPRLLTPQDLWAIKRVGNPALSPDGKHAVFPVQQWNIEKNKSSSNLWTVALAGGDVRQLTTAAETTEEAPMWSPDGTRIAFTSKRGPDENATLYVIPFGGGEAEKIVELPSSIAAPKWLADGKSIVFATTAIPDLAKKWEKADLEAMKKEFKRRKDSKMTAKVTENRQYRYFDKYITDVAAHRLLRVDLATKALTDLTPSVDRLFLNNGEFHYDVSPDGKMIALELNTTPPPFRDFPQSDIYLIPTDGSGTMKNVTPENKGDDAHPIFAPDSRSLLFKRTESTIHNGESQKLWRHEIASSKNVPITEALDYSIGDVRAAADGRTLWVNAEEKGVVPIFRLNADGSGLKAVHSAGTSTGLDVRGDAVVFLNDTTSRPNGFALDAKTGAVRQLTRFNDEFMKGITLGKVEPYRFKGANGADVHGWLVLPPNYDPAKKYPLVQLLHGGPHTMNRDSWSYRWNTQLFAAPGWIVTWVNRHGSTGFGEKFAQSIVNEWGDKPLEDIMKSTDVLLQRFPNIDADRMAAAGASYGGYMAAWILGHTDRFKALVDHAGVNNSYSQFATDVSHGFAEVMGGTPWGNVEGLQRNNPMFYAKNFKTPTLVIHGELDYRVPYGNALELYAALQAQGIPSRLVIFPDENHWILKPQNAIYWHWEMQSWLARFIGGKPTLEKPHFENKDAEKDDKTKEGAAKPAEAAR